MYINIYNMKILGRKITQKSMKQLGRKIGSEADVIGRKTMNTIDKLAPMAATVAIASGHPEIGAGIMAGQSAAHAIDNGIRAGVKVANAKQSRVDGRLVEFGNSADNVANEVNKTNALLRN